MKKYFDDVCQGSVEYLQSSLLENYTKDIRSSTDEYKSLCGYEDNYEEFLDYDREDK